ncbi:hypothetical protein [Phytoactinopolyspora halophila]|uniref:hypothetical protein n=1 Tax=Phytoactinopolyspora halophila TaxID=1981511 RepID=UPI001314A508|nr:hypothetical protein [Phytoactinopolyspora halophila]
MNAPLKTAAYFAVLVLVFAGAFGVGSLTASPVDGPDDGVRSDDHGPERSTR